MKQMKEILDGLKELKTMQDELIAKIDGMTTENPSVVVVPNNTTTVEERISKLEEKVLEIRGKQYEQDQLIDRLFALTTRLEARINLIQSKL